MSEIVFDKEYDALFKIRNNIIDEETMDYSLYKIKNYYYAYIELLKMYMSMGDDEMKINALYGIGTYLHKEFPSYPYLFINAMKGSGKTRLLNIHEALVWNGEVVISPTEATLFRNAAKKTFIFDEIESIAQKERSGFRELLNSGYKRGGKVQRIKEKFTKEGKDFITETFDLYAPKILANIWGMENVLNDRALTTLLEKSDDPSKVKPIQDFSSNPYFLELKKGLNELKCSLCSVVSKKQTVVGWNLFVFNKYNTLITLNTLNTLITLNTQQQQPKFEDINDIDLAFYETIDSSGLEGRQLELFMPLLITAKMIDSKIFFDLLNIAKNKVIEKKSDELMESKDVALYDFVSRKEPDLRYHLINDLTEQFKAFFTAPNDEHTFINPHWMGRALKRLNLITDKRRVGQGMEVILNVQKAREKLKIFKK